MYAVEMQKQFFVTSTYIIPFINRVDLIKTCEEAGWNPAKENFANVYIIFLLQMQSDLLHLKSD